MQLGEGKDSGAGTGCDAARDGVETASVIDKYQGDALRPCKFPSSGRFCPDSRVPVSAGMCLWQSPRGSPVHCALQALTSPAAGPSLCEDGMVSIRLPSPRDLM